jgi:hypothetical protein
MKRSIFIKRFGTVQVIVLSPAVPIAACAGADGIVIIAANFNFSVIRVIFRPAAPCITQINTKLSGSLIVPIAHENNEKKHRMVKCHALDRNTQMIDERVPLLNQRKIQLIEKRELVRIVNKLRARQVRRTINAVKVDTYPALVRHQMKAVACKLPSMKKPAEMVRCKGSVHAWRVTDETNLILGTYFFRAVAI